MVRIHLPPAQSLSQTSPRALQPGAVTDKRGGLNDREHKSFSCQEPCEGV
jgi:hypothetical protein